MTEHILMMGPNGPIPIQINQQQSQRPNIPPRVMVAMEFLQRCSAKTSLLPMPTYSSDKVEYTPIDGQKLTDEEATAQATACDLLSRYFQGSLPECGWDKTDSEEQKDGLNQLRIRCPNCGGSPTYTPACQVCGGAGEVMVCHVGTKTKRRKS